jgi:hypothetical protein
VTTEIKKRKSKPKGPSHILSRAELLDIAEKCFQFCIEATGVQLYPYQEQFARRICQSIILEDGEEITALFARQSGKTESVSVAVVGLSVILPTLAKTAGIKEDDRINKYKDGLWVGIFAPNYELAGVMHSRMANRMQSDTMLQVLKDPELGIDLQGGRKVLRLPNGSFVDANSAGPQSNIEGKTYHLILCEETQDISNYKIRKSIHPMGASTNATMVKIGTPNAQKNEFFDACERNRKKTNALSPTDLPSHFQFDYEYPAKYNPRYGAYIEKEIERLGYDSDEFRMSYRLHWMLERGHFIAPEIFDSCGIKKTNKLRVKKKGKFIHFKRNESHYYNDSSTENMVASIDIGRSNDSTVVTVGKVWWDNPIMFSGEDRYHLHVVNWLEIQGDDHETQYPQILEFLGNYNIGSIIVDATGRGDPIFDRLKADLYEDGIMVHPFIFSQRSKHEGYTILYQEMKVQRLSYPASDHARTYKRWQKFVREMYELQKDWRGKYMDVKAPSSGKKGKTDGHDDYSDSLMMLCYLVNRKMVSAETASNPFLGNAVADTRRRYSAQIKGGRARRKFDGW